jgi:DNA polymerase-4
VRRTARRLLAAVDTTDGVRLLGVGVSGLADWAQQDLFDADAVWRLGQLPAAAVTTVTAPTGDDAVGGRPELGEPPGGRRWAPGQDVEHREHGRGWVQGTGLGRVTVRFESRHTGPGPVRTLPVDDPQLAVAEPEPLPEPLPVPLPVPAKSTPAPGASGTRARCKERRANPVLAGTALLDLRYFPAFPGGGLFDDVGRRPSRLGARRRCPAH